MQYYHTERISISSGNTVEFCVLLNMGCLLPVILYNRVFDTELTAVVQPCWNWKSYRVVYRNFLERGIMSDVVSGQELGLL
jgi:hypothetical protein